MPRLATTMVLLLAATGCGDDGNGGPIAGRCDDETRADVYAPGMTKDGEAGVLRLRLVQSDPAPPDKGDNSWTVDLLSLPGETPVDGAGFTVTPFMVDHGHGSPVVPLVSAEGTEGRYLISPLNLWMPGYWEVTLDVEVDSQLADTVTFAFCIEG